MVANSQSLYISTPFIQIKDAEPESLKLFINDILQISVEESLHLPGMFTIVVNNPYSPLDNETKTWQHDKLIQIGKFVKIAFRASTTEAPEFDDQRQGYIITGEITAIETHFTNATQAPIVIRGYDVSHRLHRGRYNRSFQNITDSDIVKKIAKELGLEIGKIDPSGAPHDYIFQENQSNMEFLRQRAARIGFELFVQNHKLYFRKPQANESLKLAWLVDIESFRVRVSSAEQVSAVEVRSWDYSKKQPIVSRSREHQVITSTDNGAGHHSSGKFGRNLTAPEMIVVDKPVFSSEEADAMSQALFDELGGEFVYADAQAPGDPRIRVGKVVELENMGRYNGQYYVTESRHLYYQGIYTTEFSVRGLRGGDLLNTLSPQMRLRPGQTHLVGIVTDNKDPQGWGRVRVKFPTLTPEKDSVAHSSYWARVVAVGAGVNRGFDCLPEINDEVLVAFEHGDIHRPYIIGGVWNGKDTPPEKVEDTVEKGKVRLRTFKTRTGHLLQFVEEDKNQSHTGVYIQTAGGHKIRLNDSDRSIEIVTRNNHRISLDDSSNSINLNSTGTINLQATGNINLMPTGQVAVSGNISCQSLLTGAVLIGSQIQTALNVGQQLTSLSNQMQQNTEADKQRTQALANLNNQMQQNTEADKQRTQALANLNNQLQQQLQPQNKTPQNQLPQKETVP